MSPIIIVSSAIILLLIIVIGIYNRLVVLRNRFKNAFAQVDVQLKRRYDLIPNLVETAKAYMKHERETLENVIKARAQAWTASSQAAMNPGNPALMQNLLAAEGNLGGLMQGFQATIERYPDLKASRNMLQLMEELSSTENRIAFARQAFNDAVMVYNTACQVFPSSLFAGLFGFKPAAFFEVSADTERLAPAPKF
jgi:LemA protein